MGNWIENKLFDFSEKNLNLLINFKIPGLIVPDFIDKSVCDIVAKRLDANCFQNYDHLNNIPVQQVGLCHNQWCNEEPGVYFGKKSEAEKKIRDIYEGLDIDPVSEVIKHIASHCNRQVGIFEEPNFGEYFAGAFRSFKGHGRLHADHAPSHIKTPWAVTKIINQLTWNIYYSLSGSGGDLIIYDTIHTKENDVQKVAGEYYFPYTVLEREDHIRIKPKVGDLIVFNTQNFHEILGSEDGTRISQTSFMGLKSDGSIGLWS